MSRNVLGKFLILTWKENLNLKKVAPQIRTESELPISIWV